MINFGEYKYKMTLERNGKIVEFITNIQKQIDIFKEKLKKYCIHYDFRNKFSKVKVLGEGAFGIVHEIKNNKTGECFAAKHFLKEKLEEDDIKLLKNEILIMRGLNHPHILNIHEIHESSHDIILVLDLMKDGELDTFLKNKKNLITENFIKNIIREGLLALKHLNSKGVIHRDIKPENILIEYDENCHKKIHIKISDFGLSVFQGKEICCPGAGTPGFMPPEVANYKSYSINQLTSKIDIFSLGVIFFKM